MPRRAAAKAIGLHSDGCGGLPPEYGTAPAWPGRTRMKKHAQVLDHGAARLVVFRRRRFTWRVGVCSLVVAQGWERELPCKAARLARNWRCSTRSSLLCDINTQRIGCDGCMSCGTVVLWA